MKTTTVSPLDVIALRDGGSASRRPTTYVTTNCTICGVEFIWTSIDRRCLDCRQRAIAEDMARTVCSRCEQPMTPAPNKFICTDCANAALLEDVARYGSE